jgi:hypothetical protein
VQHRRGSGKRPAGERHPTILASAATTTTAATASGPPMATKYRNGVSGRPGHEPASSSARPTWAVVRSGASRSSRASSRVTSAKGIAHR